MGGGELGGARIGAHVVDVDVETALQGGEEPRGFVGVQAFAGRVRAAGAIEAALADQRTGGRVRVFGV